jgi:hypothetical protein
MLNDYAVCPRRFHHRYILKDLPREGKSQAQLDGDAVHEALKKRLRLGAVLPEPFEHHEPLAAQVAAAERTMLVELKLGCRWEGGRVVPCDFFADHVWGRGIADVVLMDGDAALLLDWKNGKVREDPRELELQALLLRIKHANLTRISGAFVWLQQGAVGVMHDLSDFKATWRSLNRQLAEMEQRLAEGDWPPDEGPLCGYCPVPRTMCEWKREPKQ